MNRSIISIFLIAICFAVIAGTWYYAAKKSGTDEVVHQEVEDVPAQTEVEGPTTEQIITGLNILKKTQVKLANANGQGGALALLGDLAIYSNRTGHIQVFADDFQRQVDSDFKPVPMNTEGLLRDSAFYNSWYVIPNYYRILSLHVENFAGDVRLYAVHHYFQDRCFWIRISYCMVNRVNGRILGSDWQLLRSFEPGICPAETQSRYGGHQSGGGIFSFDDDWLLVSIGDVEQDGSVLPYRASQDDRSPYGKIWLVHKRSGDLEMYAKGLRNPQGMTRDTEGRIWTVGHGPRGGDELNLIEPGENYGWPLACLCTGYDFEPWPGTDLTGSHRGFTAPVYSWTPSVAPSSLMIVKGDHFPFWQGDLLMGTLRARTLIRLRIHQNRVMTEERIHMGQRIRDMLELPTGKLALMTDEGFILLLENIRSFDKILSTGSTAVTAAIMEQPVRDPKARLGRDQFKLKCLVCHRLDGVSELAPYLNDIRERTPSGISGYNYSATLREMGADGQLWTEELLTRFLLRGPVWYRGSIMPKVPLSRDHAEGLAKFLMEL